MTGTENSCWLDPGRNPGNPEISSDLQGKHFPPAGFPLHMQYPSCFWFVLGFFSEGSDVESGLGEENLE